MDAIKDALSDTQKTRLQEVADLMLAIYRTLVRMRYLDPLWINEGPHDIDVPSYQSLNLDPSIIYLYSILPYVDQDCEKQEFFQGGEFADFRDFDHASQGRDPFHAENEEEAMRPWMTPLSQCGNHRSAIIYSARKHCIWILDQMGGSTDHNIHEGCEIIENEGESDEEQGEDHNSQEGEHDDEPAEENSGQDETLVQADAQDHDSEDDDEMTQSADGRSSEGDSAHETDDNTSISEGDEEMSDYDEDEDDDDEEDEELEGAYDEEDCRSASRVLIDIITWFRTLKENPGGDGQWLGDEWEPDFVIPLYTKHGWPDNFDGDAFEADQLRSLNIDRAKSLSESPLGDVEFLKKGLEWTKNRTLPGLRDKVAAAKTPGEEWLARWHIFEAENEVKTKQTRLKNAEEKLKRECPDGVAVKEGDLPMWEAKAALIELGSHRRNVRELKAEVQQIIKGGDTDEDLQRASNKLSRAERRMVIYENAYEAARVDAERLCPGRSLPVCRGEAAVGLDLDAELRDNELFLSVWKTEVEAIREWMKDVPAEVEEVRRMAQETITRMKGYIEGREGKNKSYGEYLREL